MALHSDGAIKEPAKNSASTLSIVSCGAMPSAPERAAIASSTPPVLMSQALIASRRPIASRTRSRNVWSAPAVMAVPSARPSGPSGAAAPSSSTANVNCSRSCTCAVSSSTLKRAVTFASKGNWCRSWAQKAWMVCTLRPPGVSSARAKSRRARARFAPGNEVPSVKPDRSRTAASRAASSSVVQCASVSNTRFAIFAAAALVKVMQRIFSGSTPASSRLITRCASTCVLPDPALAATHAETAGSDTAACTRRTSEGMTFGDLMGSRSRPRDRRSPTIP